MSVERDYDTTNLNALRQELARLNEAALASGLVAPRDGRIEGPRKTSGRRVRRRSTTSMGGQTGRIKRQPASPDAGKAAAGRLLKLSGRIAGDKTLDVPGTAFTEGGVARLLAHIGGSRRLRRNAWLRFRLQMHGFLTRPVSSGIRTVAGVSVDRLQVVWRQLRDIEQNGWVRFQDKRSIRRLPSSRPSGSLPGQAVSARASAARAPSEGS